ncbi:hypothetical protein [Listeria seeligeri]|uniref:hypothetical protein n=1 Tax=Listeria seeligeri TaxID=1640 RepID=UPI00162A6EC3|nr:hypothetical protein [Listeria seeligeri]MBC1533465.1 hypothetical protein [Listeria seeligeri]MBC1740481.1 hypothetical protein [Listeria seeligeri]MBC1746077.1 hypothetical protein [Listeria seeligeri]MBC1748945.1 hypothetical protein [Listeria seeligeri]MBC1821768.1 hypothetical protein [Listeria seeligeri]
MTRYEEDLKQIIVELNQIGHSVRGLAKEYGISGQTSINGNNYIYLISPQD